MPENKIGSVYFDGLDQAGIRIQPVTDENGKRFLIFEAARGIQEGDKLKTDWDSSLSVKLNAEAVLEAVSSLRKDGGDGFDLRLSYKDDSQETSSQISLYMKKERSGSSVWRVSVLKPGAPDDYGVRVRPGSQATAGILIALEAALPFLWGWSHSAYVAAQGDGGGGACGDSGIQDAATDLVNAFLDSDEEGEGQEAAE